MKKLALLAIKLYQKTRILRRSCCRFYPSCSSYAFEAIDRHGLINGFLLSAVRVSKCHPLHDGGVDEVPKVFSLESFN